MPLQLNAFNNNAMKQKVTQIADALLAVYDRSTHHNDQIMSNRSTLLDELAYLELNSEDTFEDITSFVTITVSALKDDAKNTYICIRDYNVNDRYLKKFHKLSQTYRDQQLLTSFKYPIQYHNSDLVDMMNQYSFGMRIASQKNSQENYYAITKEILTALTQSGPLSEIIAVTQKTDFTDPSFSDHITDDMPLIKQCLKELLYDNGLENHVPNLHDLFTSLLIFLILATVSTN